jgi:phage-related protein
VRAALDLSIPGAVLRDEAATIATSPSVAAPATADLVVPNPGTADQYELAITLTGTASTVRLTNLTWDPTAGTYLEFNGTLGGGVTIDTAAWTATRDGISVIGLVAHAGHERWLPLAPGNNTIRIAPTGGNVTVSVSHLAAYL